MIPKSSPLATERQIFSDSVMNAVERAIGYWYDHWLALCNTVAAALFGLPLLAPLLMAAGWQRPALWLYAFFGPVCHQLPGHSYFIQNYPACICQRCLAIYGSSALAGLLFALTGRRWRPLPWKLFAVACLPIAIDGLTQLFGWRESTWWLRSLTGGLFAMAGVWAVYPRFQVVMRRDAGLPPARSTEG